VLEKIIGILAEKLEVDPAGITLETRFKEDLGADSLDLFELVLDLEDEYGIKVPSEDLEKLTSVGKVIEYLQRAGIQE